MTRRNTTWHNRHNATSKPFFFFFSMLMRIRRRNDGIRRRNAASRGIKNSHEHPSTPPSESTGDYKVNRSNWYVFIKYSWFSCFASSFLNQVSRCIAIAMYLQLCQISGPKGKKSKRKEAVKCLLLHFCSFVGHVPACHVLCRHVSFSSSNLRGHES